VVHFDSTLVVHFDRSLTESEGEGESERRENESGPRAEMENRVKGNVMVRLRVKDLPEQDVD
jgi:hypothetical protein